MSIFLENLTTPERVVIFQSLLRSELMQWLYVFYKLGFCHYKFSLVFNFWNYIYTSELQLGVEAAYAQALKSFNEGDVPIGSSLMVDSKVIAVGHNHRVQCGSNIRHGETDCIENAKHNVDFTRATIYSSLTSCLMCTGAIILFGIPRVVVLDNINIIDYVTDLEMLSSRGVEVTIIEHQPSIELNRRFQKDPKTRPIWLGDVGI
jgi:cytosine/creatinine deaminase